MRIRIFKYCNKIMLIDIKLRDQAIKTYVAKMTNFISFENEVVTYIIYKIRICRNNSLHF